jgi:dihydroorotate dehydrogenase electron transfer subunit
MSQEGRPTTRCLTVPQTGPSRLVFNRKVGPGWYLLRLQEKNIATTAKPGQFVQILVSEPQSFDPLLRRPFSVYDVDVEAGTYDILYIVTGRGTQWMASLPENGAPLPTPGMPNVPELLVDVIGPFGNRFTPPPADSVVLLVGGGVGVAPLYLFARELCQAPSGPPRTTLCMGARTAEQLQGIDDFRKLPIQSLVATNDGSEGYKGLVTELLEDLLDHDLKDVDRRRIRIYGCGPTAMNEALRGLAVARELGCEICLEARMACAFGICFACVVPIRKEINGPLYNRRICLEGCIFDARLLGEGLGTVPLPGTEHEGPIRPKIGQWTDR